MFKGAFGKIVNKLQETSKVSPQVQSQEDIEDFVVRLILGIPEDVASDKDIIALFGADYEPGTFMIGEIKGLPDFFTEGAKLGYNNWVRREIRNDIREIKVALAQGTDPSLSLDEAILQNIESEVIDILDYQLKTNTRLCDMIPLQEYTDVFRRIILLLLNGNVNTEINTYEELDRIGRALILRILPELDERPLFEVLKISIAGGLIGLNRKTSAAATSKINMKNIIPIYSHEILDDQLNRIKRRLIDKAAEEMAIDYWSEYERDVLKSRVGTVAFFTDDYIETMFDLKLVERQLHINKNLTIQLVPRFMRYGNDASYADVINLLNEPVFKAAKSLYREGRLQVCKNGPRAGTINGLNISREVSNVLKTSDYVVIKGARAYEMLQGIRKTTYFGFAVCREISESVTGIDAEKGKLVFIRHVPGARSFNGFRMRWNRSYVFDSGRRGFISTTTAMDYYRKYRGLK